VANEIELFKNALKTKQSEFVAVLGDEAKWRRFCATAVMLVGKNPKWLDSQHDRASLFQSCMHAAESGLSLDPNLGHVYFVPRWNKHLGKNQVCFQLGYKGLLKLAYQSGDVASFAAECVFKGDEFDYQFGTRAYLQHKPLHRSNELTHVWAMARLKTGQDSFVVLPKEEIAKAQKFSQSDYIWKSFYIDMCKKTALRRLCKLLHLCTELQRAIGIEEEVEGQYANESRPQNAQESLLDLAKQRKSDGGVAESAPALSPPIQEAECAPPSDDLSFNEALIPEDEQ
jgi:recombination protein RecT